MNKRRTSSSGKPVAIDELINSRVCVVLLELHLRPDAVERLQEHTGGKAAESAAHKRALHNHAWRDSALQRSAASKECAAMLNHPHCMHSLTRSFD